ncbi:MAG: AmmeMemoRadiSam system protein B [Candidatus Aenigmarchaeota archaeon]|nr:AmmeMemoRadiSam system protein B [Candidatus Aenigmarchaeota archaeon]
MHQPVAYGFYPGNQKELKKMVSGFLRSDEQYEAKGIVVPHAGYIFSGSVAGAVFAAAKTEKKNFILLGPNHTGYGSAVAMSCIDWRTPLGVVQTNRKMVEQLSASIEVDEASHRYEHSLEVQLPFLQMLYKDFKIVALSLARLNFDELRELSDVIASADSFFIASSDFMHFGPNYGYTPFAGSREEQLRWVKARDAEMIEKICRLDARGFYDMVETNGYTVCGYVPITLLLLIAKKLGAKRGRLISYKTSHDVHPDSSFVSYAGIALV